MPKQGRLTGVNNWRRELEPQIKVSKASISGDAGKVLLILYFIDFLQCYIHSTQITCV